MHEMTAKKMSEEITPGIPCSLDTTDNIQKELETPKRSFKRKKQTPEKAPDGIGRKYLEELKKINSSRVNETDPDRCSC
ncbi:hypothetical protein TNCT_444251 [Trichonephila clavata]|uniref:Uncharacterized protein n=1 Tax=Trichonephila clavata TaxID=2740835 RepID=A0A8X6FZJ6_TRICU|nr:hypothetical protein TNCT_444251 [Trichonephila clavata]